MKKICSIFAVSVWMLAVLFFGTPIKADAANVTTGTVGENEGIQWSYDADTKTLTMTGEDRGEVNNGGGNSAFIDICSDVENIIVKDCKLYDCSYLFCGLDKVQSIKFDNFDTSQVTRMSGMFSGCTNLTDLDVSDFDTSRVTSMVTMFNECESLTNLDVSGFDTSKVEYMGNMFAECRNLTALDVSGFDTSKVTQMNYMFNCCEKLATLDVSGFDTTQATGMQGMFQGCTSLTNLDVSDFVTSNVTGMGFSSMFSGCKNITDLDVSGFDTSNSTYMSFMFSGCSSLTALDVSSFETSKVTNMSWMFSACKNLTDLDVSGFDTSKVTNMGYMFNGSKGLINLDLSNFDLTNVTDCKKMLSGCEALATIKTPKAMTAEQTIELPGTFMDSKKNKTTVITKDLCNITLVDETMENANLEAFVERMYTVALERGAAAEEVSFYTERLLAGDSNGACLAESFLCSPEFTNKNHDAAQYVTVLYKVFFDREPAAEEVNYWVGMLNQGQSRAFVLSGFVNSVEFDNLCAEYGISRGYMYQDGKPANPGLGRFAERLYTKVLGRAGEKDGIEYWTLQMAGGACTPKDAAKSFFASDEYVNKKITNEEYIVDLYETFMDREPEEGGVPYWENLLNNGTTREQVLEGFANSAEFAGIMASFGL